MSRLVDIHQQLEYIMLNKKGHFCGNKTGNNPVFGLPETFIEITYKTPILRTRRSVTESTETSKQIVNNNILECNKKRKENSIPKIELNYNKEELFNGLYLTSGNISQKVALRRWKNSVDSNFNQEFIYDIDLSMRASE